jgi:hypothetical protein
MTDTKAISNSGVMVPSNKLLLGITGWKLE